MNVPRGRNPRREAPVKVIRRAGTHYAAPVAAWNPEQGVGECREGTALEAARRPHAGQLAHEQTQTRRADMHEQSLETWRVRADTRGVIARFGQPETRRRG